MKVLFPASLPEACEMLARPADGGPPVPIAGATDLLVHWPLRQDEHDRTYLDLTGIPQIRGQTWSDQALTLGAMTTYWDIIRDPRCPREFPLLIDAARQVGAVQIQSRGTWAGNIANGSPAADGVPVLMACDATVTLESRSAVRQVPLAEFYVGYRRSVRRPDELISSITVPRRRYDLGVFHKVGPRRAQAITKVGLAITHLADGGPGAWRIVANSVAPTVCRCPAIERCLNDGVPIRSPEDFLHAADQDVKPIDDIRSTAEYRRIVLCRLLYQSVRGRCPTVT